jgi:hypothetical protein
MTRDDITRMAREAGCVDPMVFLASYERFAALVAAAEREACAEVCEQEACACCWSDDAQAAAEHLSERIRARSHA